MRSKTLFSNFLDIRNLRSDFPSHDYFFPLSLSGENGKNNSCHLSIMIDNQHTPFFYLELPVPNVESLLQLYFLHQLIRYLLLGCASSDYGESDSFNVVSVEILDVACLECAPSLFDNINWGEILILGGFLGALQIVFAIVIVATKSAAKPSSKKTKGKKKLTLFFLFFTQN